MPEAKRAKGAPTPSGEEGSEPGHSRASSRRAAGLRVELPPVDAGGYLLEYLWECGPGVDSGMGLLPLGWSDLQAWQWQIGIELSPWEARTLRRLSRAYLAQAEASKKPDCPAPWLDAPTQADRQQIATHIRGLLRG